MSSAYEEGIERFPHVASHWPAWFALAQARLSAPVSPSAEYEHDLTGLMLRFLSPRRVPTVEHFDVVVQRCLADLADALAQAERAPVTEVEAWLRAAHWLGVASDHALASLEGPRAEA
jgi:hypothetical protein